MDGIDIQERYFLIKGKVTKKMGPVSSRLNFTKNKLTKLRRIFPRVLSKVRSAAFRSTVIGIVPDVLIEGFFLGIDLSQDIPRWKSQSKVSADIMKQDDILKYVSKVWFWGMFFPSTEKRNALMEMDLLASRAYSQSVDGIGQSNMMLDAMLAMPEKVGLEGSNDPIQRWEFPDGSVLYRINLEAEFYQSRREASVENENTTFDNMSDFDLMMLGMTEKSVERFVITKKTKGSSDEEIILSSGSALSILMHELDVLMEAYRKVQVTTEKMLRIYMDHIFETIDVEKDVSASMATYIGSSHSIYTFDALFGKHSKPEKELQDKEDQLRRVFERQRDQKEKDSRTILAKRLNRFSLLVEWVSGEAYRIIRAIDFMSELNFQKGSYGDEVIKLLDESVRTRLSSGADPEGLTNLIYPVSNSEVAELQKNMVRQLLEDTYTGLANITSYFPSVRFLGLLPGMNSCFRHECRNEGVNVDKSDHSNEKWCEANCDQDWNDTWKYIDAACPEENCIIPALMKKHSAMALFN